MKETFELSSMLERLSESLSSEGIMMGREYLFSSSRRGTDGFNLGEPGDWADSEYTAYVNRRETKMGGCSLNRIVMIYWPNL